MDKTCPVCPKPVDDHTVAELRDHLSEVHDHDIPFEAIPLTWQDLEVVMAGSVAVKAGTHQSPVGNYPVLVFEFTSHDGPLPPIALVLDAQHMKSVKTLVGAAVDQSISAARKAS